MKKPSKGKVVLSLAIGLTTFILVMVMFTQFKTVQETDITGIETMREAELRTELATWKSKYEEVVTKTEEVEEKIEEYNEQIESNNNLTELLAEEVEESEVYAGYTDVEGEGIIITLEDNDSAQIEASDLITLVNELKVAGAEAISINGGRIVSTTDIVDINYKYIFINTNSTESGVLRISSPYVVKAIGDQKYLESAITVKYGYIDSMEANEKTVSYTLSDSVMVEKYNGDLSYEYATDVE